MVARSWPCRTESYSRVRDRARARMSRGTNACVRETAPDRGAQQSCGIQRVRGKHDAQSGDMREHALAALRVINRAAGKISADGDSNYGRAGERIIRPP